MNYAETTGVERDTCSYWLTLFSEHKSVEPTRIMAEVESPRMGVIAYKYMC
jgi:hypothetical protein